MIGGWKRVGYGRIVQLVYIITYPNKLQEVHKFCTLQIPGNLPHVVRQKVLPVEVYSNDPLTLCPPFFAVFSGREGR